jgi:hypothetical protein
VGVSFTEAQKDQIKASWRQRHPRGSADLPQRIEERIRWDRREMGSTWTNRSANTRTDGGIREAIRGARTTAFKPVPPG